MSLASEGLRRAVRSRQITGKPIVTSLRRDKVDALKARVSQGQVSRENLNTEDGFTRFIYGVTPLDSADIVVG